MAIKIGEETYLTVPEAITFMNIHAALMSRYIHRGEFAGVIDLNSTEPLTEAMAKHGVQVDENTIVQKGNRIRRFFLIPVSSLVNKMARRVERKFNAAVKKKAKADKKAGVPQVDIELDIEVS